MNKRFLKDSLGWGLILWLIGYVLGIILFMIVPENLIGLVITPLGTALTVWVLMKKIQGTRLAYYLKLSVIWTLIAVIFDYLFIVQAFQSDNYYKMDVYLYYALTFVLPLLVGWWKTRPAGEASA